MKIHCAVCYEETDRSASCEHCGGVPKLRDTWWLTEMLGHGAQGYTWKAVDDHDEVVAIKELSFRRLTDMKAVDLFEREAKTLRTLNHGGIPNYLDHFSVDDPRHVSLYLVQEFIDGDVLCLDQRWTEEELVDLLVQMEEILSYLSSLRPPVIHRDIKPSNIMQRTDGSYVLIDFGSTRKALEGTVGGSTVAGTFGYMAPEQLAGRATTKSDVYGLGATVIALLAGADASQLLGQPGVDFRRRVKGSPRLLDLLEEMVAPIPDDRPAGGFAARLEEPEPEPEPPQRTKRATPKRAAREPAKSKPTKPKPIPRPEARRDIKRITMIHQTVQDWTENPLPALLITFFITMWFLSFHGFGVAMATGALLLGVPLVGLLGYARWSGAPELLWAWRVHGMRLRRYGFMMLAPLLWPAVLFAQISSEEGVLTAVLIAAVVVTVVAVLQRVLLPVLLGVRYYLPSLSQADEETRRFVSHLARRVRFAGENLRSLGELRELAREALTASVEASRQTARSGPGVHHLLQLLDGEAPPRPARVFHSKALHSEAMALTVLGHTRQSRWDEAAEALRELDGEILTKGSQRSLREAQDFAIRLGMVQQELVEEIDAVLQR